MLNMVSKSQTGSLVTPNPRVSVIIPAYNIARFIRETLDSVLAQTFTDYEIVVVNDGSPDSPELVSALEPYMEKIVYVEQNNQGAGAARNTALRTARGEYVAFLDGDDLWQPSHLSDQLALLEGEPPYDLVYADAEMIGSVPKAFRTCMDANPSEGEATFESLLGGRCSVITSTVVTRREPILRIGLFDESLRNAQDFDLWVRLAKDTGARITYQRKVTACHRIYEGSLASDEIRSLEAEVRVLTKVLQRTDLTNEEEATIKRTLTIRNATIEVLRGKRLLLEGKLEAAANSFAKSNALVPGWKLSLVLFFLRVAPRMFQRVYRATATQEAHSRTPAT